MCLCRVLSLADDGHLRIVPAPELERLRKASAAEEFGVNVRMSPDGVEQTRIYYNSANDRLCLDPIEASENPEMIARNEHPGPLVLGDDERFRLRLFLDHSIVEVYADERQCLTKRIYPSRRDSQRVAVFSTGGDAAVRSIDAWEMETIWPQVYVGE